MRGCKFIFGDIEVHTGKDLDLVQEVKEIDPPEAQTYTVEVPGRNGKLRLTKALTGRVTYFNREIRLQYFACGPRSKLLKLCDFFNMFHGETIRIVDDDTPEHYYEGEATVNNLFINNYLQISVTLDADPFRRLIDPIVRVYQLSSTPTTVYINNPGKEVIPTITTTGNTQIKRGERTLTVNTVDAYDADEMILEHGLNELTISGSGTLKISYREAII